MDDIQLRKSEICFVTSVNKLTRTFFAQLCRTSNDELIEFNNQINEYCAKETAANTASSPKRYHTGELICARFARDERWYRAMVLKRDKSRPVYSVLFVDYGNVETVGCPDMVLAEISKLPIMSRAPFGISCFLKDSENYKPGESENLLECLSQHYVMIKFLERQTRLQWKVDIPLHAYNIPFWLIFKPELCAGQMKSTSSTKLVGQTPGAPAEAQAAPISDPK